MKTVTIKKHKIWNWCWHLKLLLQQSKQTWNATGMTVDSLFNMGLILAPEELCCLENIEEARFYCAAAIDFIKSGKYSDLEYDAKNDVIQLRGK